MKRYCLMLVFAILMSGIVTVSAQMNRVRSFMSHMTNAFTWKCPALKKQRPMNWAWNWQFMTAVKIRRNKSTRWKPLYSGISAIIIEPASLTDQACRWSRPWSRCPVIILNQKITDQELANCCVEYPMSMRKDGNECGCCWIGGGGKVCSAAWTYGLGCADWPFRRLPCVIDDPEARLKWSMSWQRIG